MPVERPILMDQVSVQGFLDNRKTQTRRVIKPQPEAVPYKNSRGFIGWDWPYGKGTIQAVNDHDLANHLPEFCPYGRVGDRLWVREAYRHYANKYHQGNYWALVEYRTGETMAVPFGEKLPPTRSWWNTGKMPWTASILMPRWASRILLELTGVRIERVRQISFEDCSAEGVISTPFWGGDVDWDAIKADPSRPLWTPPPGDEGDDEINQGWMDYARGVFITRWNSINAKRGFGWAVNPWVWVLAFKVLEIKVRPRLSFYLDEVEFTEGAPAHA